MTKRYIGTKQITAWPQDMGGRDGYSVIYADGYTSWSPKDAFEEAYRVIEGEGQVLTFGDALVMLRAGKKVTRAPWKAGGVFVYYVPAAAYPAQTGIAKHYFGENALVPYHAYLAIKRADETVCVFVPGMDSILADDWIVLE
ncbi:DUF2829 domain-containing protein [Burkholderia metallica]|uniref:DUF2829 domain-containing protein n=1 Tax=Burkholderia metallica TaxID=488729 RepID=UPI001CF15A88|nr:DUF2829 domain-containing protein [Burkholderia metallica]MCA8018092.1 DUF2829 domain-containing protein [Burkholderia metallica]